MITPSVLLQYLVPQHLVSRIAGGVAASRYTWISRPLIRLFIRLFDVDMSEAERPEVRDYESFNDFFTRPLRAHCRPLPAEEGLLVSPVDGTVSQCGSITDGRVLQAKGMTYSLSALLGLDEDAPHPFSGGSFITLYLSPRDYHRVHAPIAGRLVRATYIPGSLFSVDDRTTRSVPDLFARNERLVAHFDTRIGPVAVVMVGAIIVAGISTVWRGTPYPARRRVEESGNASTVYARGEEIGRFSLGSTVIVVTPGDSTTWRSDLVPGRPVRVRESLGSAEVPSTGSSAGS